MIEEEQATVRDKFAVEGDRAIVHAVDKVVLNMVRTAVD